MLRALAINIAEGSAIEIITVNNMTSQPDCFNFSRQLFKTMWIQVRSMDGRKSVRVDNLSKLTTIEELRVKLSSDFDAAPDKQRLFYRGKQASKMVHTVGLF